MEFYVFALLPFALLSLFERGRHRATAGFGFLAALAPVVAKGIGSLIGHKQQQSAQKQAEEQRRLEAQRADELARAQWEAEMNSPAAQAARFKNTMALGRLAGAMGGMDKIPPSMAKFYQSMRAMPEYKGTSSYIPTPKKGGGVWDFLGGVTDALSYLDTSKIGKGTPGINPRVQAMGNQAAASGGLGALQGGGMATSLSGGGATSAIADLTNRLRAPQPIQLSSGQQINPFDPKFGRG